MDNGGAGMSPHPALRRKARGHFLRYLHKGFVQGLVLYLESRLIRLSLEAKRTPLDNQVQPKLPTLNEAD